jgi:acid phosphatase class B
MMADKAYCSSCGCMNNGNLSYCGICGGNMTRPVKKNPINSESFRAIKLVIFDIDNTILNTSQRYKDAQRAGLVDKEGKAKRSGLQTPGNASKKAQDFLYTKDSLQKDRVIPGAKDLIDHFIRTGHLIAYVTARSYKYYEVTRDQLINKEFPIFQTQDGRDLLSLNNKPGSSKSSYKRGEFESLRAQYDIVAVFDDTVEVLQEAAQMGIPGIYESINDYNKFLPKSNPAWGPKVHEGPHGTYVTGTSNMDTATAALPDKDDEDERTVGETSYTPEPEQRTLGDFLPAKQNPHSDSCKVMIKLKNKTQSDKVYKIRKALSEKGINFDTDVESGRYPRIMTFYLDQSLEGGTAKQVIAQLKKAKIPHKVEKVKSNPSNPGKIEKGKNLYKHMNGKEVGKQTTEKIDIGDVWYQVGEGGCWSIGYMSGKETKNKDQKYIHNFNEETKDGNTPKLYATMPENGKPLLIIKGGTWKIRTDESGMAWIYD